MQICKRTTYTALLLIAGAQTAWAQSTGGALPVNCVSGCSGGGGGGGASTIADGADVAQGTTTDTAWVSGNGTLVAIGKGIFGKLGSPFQVGGSIGNTTFASTQSGAWNITNITGTVSLPTGASTAAKQPALGIAGTASADVLSIQGIASMTALKVDGSAVTQPVSGTFWQATQPVSGTVTANAGTNLNTSALALDASVTGLQVSQGATTSGIKGNMIQGAVTTAAPAYTTAQTSPLSLTTAGLLRTDGSAVTQPVSNASLPLPAGAGTAANQTAPQTPLTPATATATKGLQLGGQYTSAGPPAFTNGQQGAVPLDQNGALNAGFDGATFAPASVTSAATIFTQDMTGYAGIGVQVTSAGSSTTITYETSEDNTNWFATNGQIVAMTASYGFSGSSTTTGIMVFDKKARYFRARVSSYGSGTVTVVYGLHKTAAVVYSGQVAPAANFPVYGPVNSGSAVSLGPVSIGVVGRTSNLAVANNQNVYAVSTLAGATIVYPWSIPEMTWQFAAASGGIVNSTTAVTLQAAGAAGIRNYITQMQVSANGTVATASEIVIRDGAAGTVIWRGSLPAATQNPLSIRFEPPLKSTAATLVEFATLTGMGASSAVYVNAQGFQGP